MDGGMERWMERRREEGKEGEREKEMNDLNSFAAQSFTTSIPNNKNYY